jgi:hypothetical protein
MARKVLSIGFCRVDLARKNTAYGWEQCGEGKNC